MDRFVRGWNGCSGFVITPQDERTCTLAYVSHSVSPRPTDLHWAPPGAGISHFQRPGRRENTLRRKRPLARGPRNVASPTPLPVPPGEPERCQKMNPDSKYPVTRPLPLPSLRVRLSTASVLLKGVPALPLERRARDSLRVLVLRMPC